MQPKLLAIHTPLIGSEDCLTLNVWAPASAGPPLPVMVYFHGGGHVSGASSDRVGDIYVYDGQRLAECGPVVVVTVTHRVGPLGFIGHPALSAESVYGGSGNYGHMDQIEALKWVQRNISEFGGDPTRVAIFGQSAGAHSVAVLLASPLARGLFSRAVLQSGGYLTYPLEYVHRMGERLAAAAGCASGPNLLACLREKDAADIVSTLRLTWEFRKRGVSFAPNVDGFVLTAPILDVLRSGSYNRVPTIIGTTADEYSTMIELIFRKPARTWTQYRRRVIRYFGRRAAGHLLRIYARPGYESPQKALIAMFGDLTFVCPTRHMSRTMAGHQPGSLWRYVFAHTFQHPPLRCFGAGHGFDAFFAFHNFPNLRGFQAEPEEIRLSHSLMRYWTRFAAQGDPNGGDDPRWQPYDCSKDNYLEFDQNLVEKSGHRRIECDQLDALA